MTYTFILDNSMPMINFINNFRMPLLLDIFLLLSQFKNFFIYFFKFVLHFLEWLAVFRFLGIEILNIVVHHCSTRTVWFYVLFYQLNRFLKLIAIWMVVFRCHQRLELHKSLFKIFLQTFDVIDVNVWIETTFIIYNRLKIFSGIGNWIIDSFNSIDGLKSFLIKNLR